MSVGAPDSASANSLHRRITAAGSLIALGIVYGDIGTSPLYTVRGVFVARPVTEDVVLGTVSAIIWTLTLLTTVKYVFIAMRADNHGEGGIMSLYALLRRLRLRWLYLPAIVGGAALLADSIITPPISVSSAIEGLQILKPNLETVPIVLAILVALFAFQQFGTALIGKLFGPVMLVFFCDAGRARGRPPGHRLGYSAGPEPVLRPAHAHHYSGGVLAAGLDILVQHRGRGPLRRHGPRGAAQHLPVLDVR